MALSATVHPNSAPHPLANGCGSWLLSVPNTETRLQIPMKCWQSCYIFVIVPLSGSFDGWVQWFGEKDNGFLEAKHEAPDWSAGHTMSCLYVPVLITAPFYVSRSVPDAWWVLHKYLLMETHLNCFISSLLPSCELGRALLHFTDEWAGPGSLCHIAGQCHRQDLSPDLFDLEARALSITSRHRMIEAAFGACHPYLPSYRLRNI